MVKNKQQNAGVSNSKNARPLVRFFRVQNICKPQTAKKKQSKENEHKAKKVQKRVFTRQSVTSRNKPMRAIVAGTCKPCQRTQHKAKVI